MFDITKSSTSVAAALGHCESSRDLFASEKGAAEWFEDSIERALAWAAMRLHGRGEPVDLVTIGRLIHSEPKVWRAVGEHMSSVSGLWGSHVTTAHFRWHLENLREEWTSRQTKRLLLDESESEVVDPGAIARKLEDLVEISATNTLKDSRQACLEFCDQLEKDYQLATTDQLLKTGFNRLDAMTGGLKPEYWVIGARPSVGKTSLAISLIEKLALQQNVPCLFASIEMPTAAVVRRMVSMLTGIEFNALPMNAQRAMTAVNQIQSAPLYIEDGNISIEELAAKARVAQRRWGIKVIFVDYIQFLKSSEVRAKRGDRRIEVGEISRQLKNISRDLEVPVIALAQLSRDQEKRGSKPRLSDLKETGDIEQDADLVGLLYESAEDADGNFEDEPAKRISLDIAKQRNGRTGFIPLEFEKTRMRFSEWRGA